METKAYTKQELKHFIHSDFFYDLPNIPISKHRAISQINNPRTDENDILLVVQYDQNKVVGYLGILPDFLFNGQHSEKIGWLSCFWVDDDYKSKNVAANLFLRVIRAWDQKILITNIVPWLEPIYQKTKIFKPTVYKNGFRGYLRFNFSKILPPKKKIFEKTRLFLKLIDTSLNALHDIYLSLYKQKSIEENWEYLPVLDEECEVFLKNLKQNDWNNRGKDELNWIITYPWILQGAHTDFNSNRYFFSSLNASFYYQLIKFIDAEKKIKAVVLMSIKDGNLSVPYIYSNLNDLDFIGNFIINTMIRLKLDMITVFNESIIQSLKTHKTPFYFNKTIKKPYFISKRFDFINDLKFQDGDGDCVFY